jgi:hypothetical protein
LLRLIDPERFVSFETFEQARRANIPIVESLNALLRIPPDREGFERNLSAALKEPLLRHDKVLADFAKRVGSDWNEAQRVHTARTLESRSLLADVMVRTRKREAFPNRVIRRPWVLHVRLSPQERELYSSLSDRIRSLARRQNPGTPGEFVLISRQRQLASSIPAALASWNESGHLQELLWEDLGAGFDGEETSDTSLALDDLATQHDFVNGDTKYRVFSEAIREHLKAHTSEKIVVFAFFRGTLNYLKKRLEADGVRCALIYGGMAAGFVDNRVINEKTAEIERFRDAEGPSVLLSSEVGSEGIDLQFAGMLFNYDLPWNPMRVEQRIGRIDRIGQQRESILIGHFATEGTIDDKILNRLYQRVNVFRESIGDLDDIFGETIQEIIFEYYRGNLTPRDVERRLEQSRLAEESTRHTSAELKREASALAGHAEFILRSIDESHRRGHYIRPADLQSYVAGFLHDRYPGSQIELVPEASGRFTLELSARARDALEAFMQVQRPAHVTRLAAPGASVTVRFDPEGQDRGRRPIETINVIHPLILWIKRELADRSSDVVPAVAVAVTREAAGVDDGLYLFATDFWRFEGLRKLAMLRHSVLSAKSGRFLPSEASEQVIEAAAYSGQPVEVHRFAEEHESLFECLEECESKLVDEFLQESETFESENTNRLEQTRQLLEARAHRIIGVLQVILANQLQYGEERRRRIARVTEARIRNAKDDRDKQIARIERQATVEHGRRPIIGGIIVVGGGCNGEQPKGQS